MRLESRKYLHDIQQAANRLFRFSEGRSFADYESDEMLRAAVERQFEIIGEALSQLAKSDPALAERVHDHQRIIAFRNILIHGYAEVDNRLVWSILETQLTALRNEVDQLLLSPD